MVNKCANPECNKTLRYLREGIVYLFSNGKEPDKMKGGPQRLEHFWLCGACAAKWTLKLDLQHDVQMIPKTRRSRRGLPTTEANVAFPYAR